MMATLMPTPARALSSYLVYPSSSANRPSHNLAHHSIRVSFMTASYEHYKGV